MARGCVGLGVVVLVLPFQEISKLNKPKTSLIEYACADSIALITLNRAEKLNAFTDDMVRELGAVLHRFDMDEEAQVAILSGRGRAFSSGADVRQRQLRSRDDLAQAGGPVAPDAQSSDLLLRCINWKPVIAAVHGYALGMGLGLALECDLVVAETGTKFQITETSRGLGASKFGALLSFRGHWGFATEMALTGRFFTAEEAHAAAVIDRVAPSGAYLDMARELATAIARNPPLGVRANVRTRRWRMEEAQRDAGRQASLSKLYLTEDFAEAVRAFSEKRPPAPFKGR